MYAYEIRNHRFLLKQASGKRNSNDIHHSAILHWRSPSPNWGNPHPGSALSIINYSGIWVKYLTDSGPVDYLLFIDKKPIGVIEAKRAEEGVRLTSAED